MYLNSLLRVLFILINNIRVSGNSNITRRMKITEFNKHLFWKQINLLTELT